MQVVIVIPARYASKRFPGKPLHVIAGRSMIERVHSIANSLTQVSEVLVATDDERILAEVKRFGGRAVSTSHDCTNGTERVFEAVSNLDSKPDIVINFQGDTPLTPPSVLEDLIAVMRSDSEVEIATPAVRLSVDELERFKESKQVTPSSGCTVVFDKNKDALYFSKAIIPFVRTTPADGPPVWRHLGIYGYRFSALEKYLSLEPSSLELVEGLEQLRALENGMKIRIVPTDLKGRRLWSVDSPEDAQRVEAILAEQGELKLSTKS